MLGTFILLQRWLFLLVGPLFVINGSLYLCVSVAERYPEYLDFVFSKKAYAPVTANSPLFAVDCEMVR